MTNLDAIPEMKQVDDFLSGKVFRDKQTVPQVEIHEPLYFATNPEQAMGERAAERAEELRDALREDGICE